MTCQSLDEKGHFREIQRWPLFSCCYFFFTSFFLILLFFASKLRKTNKNAKIRKRSAKHLLYNIGRLFHMHSLHQSFDVGYPKKLNIGGLF